MKYKFDEKKQKKKKNKERKKITLKRFSSDDSIRLMQVMLN